MERLIHFRNRNDVIKFAMGHIPKSYRSIARSFEEGSVEFLGGFTDIFMRWGRLSGLFPGWIIRTTSKFGKIYYLFVWVNHLNNFKLSTMDEIDWRFWDGDKSDNPLYQGDHPEKYRELKNIAVKNE